METEIRVGDLVYVRADAGQYMTLGKHIPNSFRTITHIIDSECIKVGDEEDHNAPSRPRGWFVLRKSVEKVEADEALKELLKEL